LIARGDHHLYIEADKLTREIGKATGIAFPGFGDNCDVLAPDISKIMETLKERLVVRRGQRRSQDHADARRLVRLLGVGD
jgi:hypothetical protein